MPARVARAFSGGLFGAAQTDRFQEKMMLWPLSAIEIRWITAASSTDRRTRKPGPNNDAISVARAADGAFTIHDELTIKK